MPFVAHSKEGNRHVVVLKYAALFYWVMWPTIIVTGLAAVGNSSALHVAAVVAWILLLAVAIPYWPMVFKLRRMMKEKPIQARGSKYSFSNPLRYEWEE